jgi:hypothetical protein
MTGFKSKKALTDRMTEADAQGLRTQNEWQLGMYKLQLEIEARKDENMALMLEIDRLYQELRKKHG